MLGEQIVKGANQMGANFMPGDCGAAWTIVEMFHNVPEPWKTVLALGALVFLAWAFVTRDRVRANS